MGEIRNASAMSVCNFTIRGHTDNIGLVTNIILIKTYLE
jgi:hypothetical protein